MPEPESTYDLDTDAGQVRLLISDVGGDGGSSFLFNDDEIATFLALRKGNVLLAAATALRAMADNEAMVAKVIKFLELETNGDKTAAALRAAADDFEAQADDDELPDFAEIVSDSFALRRARGLEF